MKEFRHALEELFRAKDHCDLYADMNGIENEIEDLRIAYEKVKDQLK